MAGRKILEVSKGPYLVKLFYNREYQEYSAKLYRGKVSYPEATYFTNDRKDAEISAGFMVREAFAKLV